MKLLLRIRNTAEKIYKSRQRLFDYIIRAALTFISLLFFRYFAGYNAVLSNIWFVAGFSVICGFIPPRGLLLVILAYVLTQEFFLAAGAGIIMLIIFIILYLIYFRLDSSYAFIIVLMPVLFALKIELLAPLVLAVTGAGSSVLASVGGCVVYFFVYYVHANAAVISTFSSSGEFSRMAYIINSVFTNQDFIYVTIILVFVFAITHFSKKLNVNHSNEVAVLIGAGMNIVLMLSAILLTGNVTVSRVLEIVTGSVVSAAIAIIAEYIVLPLDYSRTELLEFEDEEYYYYVRAVPKSAIDKENVRVTRINRRSFLRTSDLSREKKK